MKYDAHTLRLQLTIAASKYPGAVLERDGPALPHAPAAYLLSAAAAAMPREPEKATIKQGKRKKKIRAKHIVSTRGTLHHTEPPKTSSWKGKTPTSQLQS